MEANNGESSNKASTWAVKLRSFSRLKNIGDYQGYGVMLWNYSQNFEQNKLYEKANKFKTHPTRFRCLLSVFEITPPKDNHLNPGAVKRETKPKCSTRP